MSSGLTVRWSLTDAAADVHEQLASYVASSSHQRFEGMDGLRYKTWRVRPGEWFEGNYVFVDDAARAAFEEQFRAGAADAPGSKLVGAAPILIEACDIVAIAEGASSFGSAPSYGG